MSLTDQAELKEMYNKPKIRHYNPRFAGDGPGCNPATGHCSNTDACNDCILYQTTMEVRAEKDIFKDLRKD